jgi:chromosome segregation ATPase
MEQELTKEEVDHRAAETLRRMIATPPQQPAIPVLDYLREQFSRLDSRLDRLTADMGEIKQRLTTLEIQLGGSVATEQSHYGQTMLRLDRLDSRLERIERRFDLTGAPV